MHLSEYLFSLQVWMYFSLPDEDIYLYFVLLAHSLVLGVYIALAYIFYKGYRYTYFQKISWNRLLSEQYFIQSRTAWQDSRGSIVPQVSHPQYQRKNRALNVILGHNFRKTTNVTSSVFSQLWILGQKVSINLRSQRLSAQGK